MGVDLTILPQSYATSDCKISFHALELTRQRELWPEIEASGKITPVGMPVRCHFARTEDGETCYGEITETPYGDPITSMSALDLVNCMDQHNE